MASAAAAEPGAVNENRTPIAQLDHVTQVYGKATALDDVSLAVPAGRLVGLIGPDGVSKSTALAIIAGARHIQSGAVRGLDGDVSNATHRAAICPRIAYMPQGLGKNLYPDLSIRENIEFFGRLFGQSRRAGVAHCRSAYGHRARPICRPAGKKIVRRHAAEAWTVLLADP